MELQGTVYKYELEMNVNGLAANILLKAYLIEAGEKVFYPDNNKHILTINASYGDADMLKAAVSINVAIQTYITSKEL